MGGASSTVNDTKAAGRTDEEVIDIVLPLYYNKDPLHQNERDAAIAAWRMIMNNTSAYFKRMKKEAGPDYPHKNCMELFYFTFYTRLFDVHPIAKTLFHRTINKQGTFFVRFISMVISQLDDEEKWTKSFTNLTEIHNKMGVKAIEYGVAGEVLFYAIQTCVGPEVFNELVFNGWTKIYSKMLTVIVPLAVKFELDHKHLADNAADKRFKDAGKSSSMMSVSHPRDPSAMFSQHQSIADTHSQSPVPSQNHSIFSPDHGERERGAPLPAGSATATLSSSPNPHEKADPQAAAAPPPAAVTTAEASSAPVKDADMRPPLMTRTVSQRTEDS